MARRLIQTYVTVVIVKVSWLKCAGFVPGHAASPRPHEWSLTGQVGNPSIVKVEASTNFVCLIDFEGWCLRVGSAKAWGA